jgi:hypothetical protein
MANEVSKRNETLPATPETNSYLAYANSVASSRIVGKLLKFTKFGEFQAGEESEEVPMGTELIVHGEEMYVGWQKWEDNRPVDHIMGRLCDGFEPPKRSELGDLDKTTWEVDDNNQPRDPWQNSAYTIMFDPKAGQIYTFATSSKGGHKANGTLAKAYGQRARMAPDMFPVISLNWTEYEHSNPRFGKIRNPVFDVIGWTNRSKIDNALKAAVGEATAQAEADEQGALDYYDEKPAPKQQVQQKPAPKQAQMDRPPQSQTLSGASRKPRF